MSTDTGRCGEIVYFKCWMVTGQAELSLDHDADKVNLQLIP